MSRNEPVRRAHDRVAGRRPPARSSKSTAKLIQLPEGWLAASVPRLELHLAPDVRATLTSWLRQYSEANHLPTLRTGTLGARLQQVRLRERDAQMPLWTNVARWAAGRSLALRLPRLQLEFACRFEDGRLLATEVMDATTDEVQDPLHEPGTVGALLVPKTVALPASSNGAADLLAQRLERHFQQYTVSPWTGVVQPLKALLDAEEQADREHVARLTTWFTVPCQPSRPADWFLLGGMAAETLSALKPGERLEFITEAGEIQQVARVQVIHPADGTMEVSLPERVARLEPGILRPRPRDRILNQQRAVLQQLEQPTGDLLHMSRLIAAPAQAPVSRPIYPSRWVDANVSNNPAQAAAVALALGLEDGHGMLIQGPPGTGKSTTAAEIILQLIIQDPSVRILVASHSNFAADNILRKVLRVIPSAGKRIVRVGFYDRVAEDARPYFVRDGVPIGSRNAVFTTITSLALHQQAGAALYDYVILDEANRAGMLDSLLALVRGKRLILVGDPMQLQPVESDAVRRFLPASSFATVSDADPTSPVNQLANKSLFSWLMEQEFPERATAFLAEQNRMHPDIGELISRGFYEGRVRTGPAAPDALANPGPFTRPVVWVDTSSLPRNREERAHGGSLSNLAEAQLVMQIAQDLNARLDTDQEIGVIAAYADQRDLLRRLCSSRGMILAGSFGIQTVDACAGSEADVVILSLVRSNRRQEAGFLRLEQRLNVALSRARRLLVIVGDSSTLQGGVFERLMHVVREVGTVIGAVDLAPGLGRSAGAGTVARP